MRQIRDRSNPEISEDKSFSKCFKCGSIISSRELYESRYCENCAKDIKVAKEKGYQKCIACNEYFPPSELYNSKYCIECKKEIKICRVCSKEFIPARSYYHTCPSCHLSERNFELNDWQRLPNGTIEGNLRDNETSEIIESKKCRVCGKRFIPEKSYYHTCTSCISKI